MNRIFRVSSSLIFRVSVLLLLLLLLLLLPSTQATLVSHVGHTYTEPQTIMLDPDSDTELLIDSCSFKSTLTISAPQPLAGFQLTVRDSSFTSTVTIRATFTASSSIAITRNTFVSTAVLKVSSSSWNKTTAVFNDNKLSSLSFSHVAFFDVHAAFTNNTIVSSASYVVYFSSSPLRAGTAHLWDSNRIEATGSSTDVIYYDATSPLEHGSHLRFDLA